MKKKDNVAYLWDLQLRQKPLICLELNFINFKTHETNY